MTSELIERLRQKIDDETAHDWEYDSSLERDCINALMAMQWIPVSERLPEFDCYALITFDDDAVMEADFLQLQEVFVERFEGAILPISDVTHWMPLPSPPTQITG